MRKLLLYSCLVLITGCDIFEKDLENEYINLLAPADGTVSTLEAQTFWWEENRHANQYRIQIVRPDFVAPEQLVLDSAVTGDKITYSLTPGEYQWRVRGENSSTHTLWVTRTLTIDTTSDLSGQQVVLVTPSNGSVQSDSVLNFSWQHLSGATDYRIQIVTEGFGMPGAATIFDGVVQESPHEQEFTGLLEDYYWRVRGENQQSVSGFSPEWSVTVDTSATP